MSGTRRARPSPGAGAAIASSPWIVVSIGVIVMVVLLVVALGSARGRRPYNDAGPGPPVATIPLPGLPPATPSRAESIEAPPAPPGLSPRSTVLPSAGRPTSSPSAPAGGGGGTARPTPPPVRPLESGRYGVANTWDGGFMGEVLIVNADSTRRGWTVRLAFSEGRIVAYWVAGAEGGSGSVFDGVLTYRSGVDLASGQSVPLRFQVENTRTTRPELCTVNGSRCSGF
ncbi:cellulose binding domain-containing protein [Micromonospora inositola]|uniref:Cellulose binding domain-containing protein n=1 Tax=Micromonospora inositola TaxID=47865 RepID=A0A1C5J235_9ACTN|nr:cellulose binding domain-containing protein [Micromonospora inositola]SCG64652.1 Cellulose binding domain-containing protein [Micromonospora inositola]